jgi:hypothetical protein
MTLAHLQFLNNVIINKTKVLLLQAYMTLADLQFLNNVIINKTKVLLLQAYMTLADLQFLNKRTLALLIITLFRNCKYI